MGRLVGLVSSIRRTTAELCDENTAIERRKTLMNRLARLEKGLLRTAQHDKLREITERRVLREAMLDDLLLRHARHSSIVERQRIAMDSAAPPLSTGTASNQLSLFDRAMTSVHAIEAAVRELRPCAVPSSQSHTVDMLQVHGMRLVGESGETWAATA